jgi:(p)ppGpp synthase/HD superfamily hydrolase
MPTIEDAITLAAVAHRDQTDKAGLPYILHPLRVMGSFLAPEDEDARIVAVLHDVVEDTYVDLDLLKTYGYAPAVLEAIDAISRRHDETYPAYIERVARNPLAVRVKLADLHDNLDRRRLSTGMLSTATILKYYNAAAKLRTPSLEAN